MPWQQHVADVAGEIDPRTGRLVYREVRLTVPRQSGKALDVSTPILTATRGWVTMADLVAGDQVFHPGGHPVSVLGAFDTMLGHDCYRVTTVDGRSVVADADHLWTVQDRRREVSRGPRSARVRSFPWVTLTTRELVDRGLYRMQDRRVTTDGKEYRTREFAFRLPAQGLIESPDVDHLLIHPYLLGAWLGDGATASGRITVGADDLSACLGILADIGESIRSVRPGNTAWSVLPVGLQAALRRAGLLGNKHVPEAYLAAGTNQRLDLLRGLLDTDGSISPNGVVEFCSTRQVLADAVLYLARSLGWRPTIREDVAKLRGRVIGPRWRVCFTTNTDRPTPFRMPRKAARIPAPRSRGSELTAVSIATIEPVSSRPVRCIKVDSPDGLYLAGRDLVATHNTTLVLAKNVHRMIDARHFGGGRQHLTYVAQTRDKAREKFVDDYIEDLREISKLRGLWKPRLSNGSESIRWKNGSRWGIESTTEKAGHGSVLDVADIDEAFAQVDARAEQAMKPAMLTRPSPQLWVISTAGTDTSTYLKRKVDTGREFAEAQLDSGIAYFEWSALLDADPGDPATWWSCMPALGHTVTEDAVRADYLSMPLPEFCRAYLNWWVPKAFGLQVIPAPDWESCADPASQIAGDAVVFSLDVAPDSSWGAIAVAGARADGLPHGEVIDHRGGDGWIVGRVLELRERWGSRPVVLDPAGPAGALLPALRAAGIEPVTTSARDMAQACGALKSGAKEAAFRHTGQQVITDALAGAATRQLLDAWAFRRRSSSCDISPLVALTLALWGLSALDIEVDYPLEQSVY